MSAEIAVGEDRRVRMPAWVPVAAVGFGVAAAWIYTGRVASPGLLLAVSGGALAAVATIADPRIGLGALAFAMVLSPELGGAVYVRADDVIIGAVVIGWLARQAVRREPIRKNPLLAPMVALAAVGLGAMAVAVIGGNVDPFTRQSVPLAISVLHWAKRIEYFLVAFLVAQVLRTRREVGVFAGLLLAAAAIVGARGVAQIALHRGSSGFRLDAPFDTGQANTLGEYLMFVIALALGLLLTVRSVRLRLCLVGAVALYAYNFLYTFSRGSYVGLVVVVLVGAFLRDVRLLLVVAALALVIPSHLPAGVDARVGSIPHEVATLGVSDVGSNALLARVGSYRVAVHRLSERPVLGYGPGVVSLQRIESQYAKEAIDGGVVGLGLFLWFLVRASRLGRRVLNGAHTTGDRGIGLGYLAGVAGMAVAGLGAIPFTTIRTMEVFCFASGLAVVIWRLQREEAEVVVA